MNLSAFLEIVDAQAGRMKRENLIRFIHELARTLPGEKREMFLRRMRMAELGNDEYSDTGGAEEKNVLLIQCRKVMEELRDIEKGELYLTGTWNEEYDDWNDYGEEIIYEDPNGIGEIVYGACELVSQCIGCGQYQSARDMAQCLIALKIQVNDEEDGYSIEPLDIDGLEYHKLVNLDYRQLTINALYATYRAEKLERRAEAMFEIIESSSARDITLEAVLQNGGELADFKQFLPLWISFLGEKTDQNASRLLTEAINLLTDPDALLKNARLYSERHPELYKQYLLQNRATEDPTRLLAVGEEALRVIDDKYVIRSEIALILSRLALEAGNRETAESCWLEAFRSDTNVGNYFRLFMESVDFSRYDAPVEQICRNAYRNAADTEHSNFTNAELRENQPEKKQIFMLAILRGKLPFVRDTAMNDKGSLGWSFTFMKCGLAAFLLLLLETEDLLAGGREMVNKIVNEIGFEKECVQAGLLRTIPEDNGEWFWECFCSCKKTIRLSVEEKNDYFMWVQQLVTRRVVAIMDGNKRNYYGECAAYIAALGEVTEARGEEGGKQRVMAEFMNMYSRRRAFREELREFGMTDKR